MKYLIYIIFLLPIFSFAQIQVSDIDYQLPRDDFYRKGFMKVGAEEYFIEQGAEGTKVSLVNGGNLELVHTLTYRPSDSQLNSYAYSYENSNSGLVYDGPILYEIYWNYIYMINVVTGELVDIIDMNTYDVRIQTNFHFGDDFFFFAALGTERNGYVRLDRNTGILDTLESGGVIADATRYWVSEDSTKLTFHDLASNERSEHPFQFSEIEFIERHPSDVTTRVIIKDENGIHLLKNDASVETLNCSIPNGSKLRYVSNDRLAFTYNNGSELVFSVFDLETCMEVYSKFYYAEAPFFVFSDSQLFDEYFIFGLTSDWSGDGEFYLFDIEINEVNYIDASIDFPLLSSAVRYDNSLYFLTSNHIHYIGSLPELYRLDLEYYQTERISEQEIFQTTNITIGESQSDAELNIYYRTDTTSSLMQINDPLHSLNPIEKFDLYKNHGIHASIYADIWVDNAYFFVTSKAIYVTKNDMTSKVIDIFPVAYYSTAFKRNGGYVYVLTRLEEGGHFALKINIQDYSYTKIPLPNLNAVSSALLTTENAIVNLKYSFSNTSVLGYFKVEEEKMVLSEDVGLPDGKPIGLSKNNILYKTASSSGNETYIVNTVSEELTLTEISPESYPDYHPDGQGGFYVSDYEIGDEVSFQYLDSDGKLTELYDNFDYTLFYSGSRYDGEVKSLAFDGPEELIIVSAKEGEVKKKTIADGNLRYYQKFFWHETDNISIIEIYNAVDTDYDTYSFTFDSEPENIAPSGRDDRLVMAMVEETYAILVYKDDQHVLSFEKYDYNSGDIEKVLEFQSTRNQSFEGAPIKVNSAQYILSLNDAIHGLEPWIYNLETEELHLVKDMREGISSSNINDYTLNPESGESYFSAIKNEGDRQLFRLENSISSTEDETDVSGVQLSISPIPAKDYIFLNDDFENISILTLDGRLIENLGSYENGSAIAVDHLLNGIYLLQTRNENNQILVEKFVVHR